MESTTEKNAIKHYYTIGEVSELLGVNHSLIRFWEEEFELLNFKKNNKGNRIFTQDDINNLKMIQYLKAKGFTLEGVKEEIKKRHHEWKYKMQMLESLKKVRDFLSILRSELP